MGPPPIAHSAQSAQDIRAFILAAGYTETELRALNLTRTPWREPEAWRLLSHKVAPDSVLGLLIRLFFFGESVDKTQVTFPLDIIRQMLECGVLEQDQGAYAPNCMFVHFENLLLACDSVRRARMGEMDDLVLGVNPPTRILTHASLPPSEHQSVLDLGTGCGTIGLSLADRSNRVTGTDINPRALAFARFNAALNGIDNFETRCGDRLMPVAGETFDLIVSNPPFFLTPASKLLFTANPFALDSFVESIARAAPAYLAEGACFQMLCEWVEIHDQPWRGRLAGWFQSAGCDVLIMQHYEISPADYVSTRATEATALHGPAKPESLAEHLAYFNANNVQRVFGGLITARRNPSNHARWFVVDTDSPKPDAPIGHWIKERFANEDVLNSCDDTQLLATRPRLLPDVFLLQDSTQERGAWKTQRIHLERHSGVPARIAFDRDIADLVAQMDGSQSLDFLATVFSRKRNLPKKQIVSEFARLTRRLAKLGFISFKN